MSSVEIDTVTAPAPVVVKVLSRTPDWSSASKSSTVVMSMSMVATDTEPSEARLNEETISLVAV